MAPLEHNRDGGYEARAKQADIQAARAAAANEAFSPEALAAEAARREKALEAEAQLWRAEGREQCIRENRPIEAQYLEPEAWENEGGSLASVNAPSDERDESAGISAHEKRKSTLAERLAEAAEEEDLPEEEPEPEIPNEVMGGAHLVRWILLPAEEGDGWTLGLSTESHEDDAPDAVYLEITQAMMRKWRNEPTGVQGLNRFAAGLMEKVADSLAEDLTDNLGAALERITTGELREKQQLDPPTETSIGPDDDGAEIEGDFALESGEPVEPFASLDEYVTARDHYATVLSRDEYTAFLDENQDLEDEIERRAAEDV